MRGCWLLPATWLALGVAAAEPLSIKGLAPGMTREQLEAAHPGLSSRCQVWNRDQQLRCTYSTRTSRGEATIPSLDSIAGARPFLWLVSMRDGKVAHVTVGAAASDFERIAAALVERFGAPTKRTEGQVQNRMGAAFDQVELTWQRDGLVLMAKKRASKIDTMHLHITSEGEIASFGIESKERAKSDANDL